MTSYKFAPAILGLVCVFLFHCIQENASNPSLQLALIEAQSQVVPKPEVPQIKACVVSTQIATGKNENYKDLKIHERELKSISETPGQRSPLSGIQNVQFGITHNF